MKLTEDGVEMPKCQAIRLKQPKKTKKMSWIDMMEINVAQRLGLTLKQYRKKLWDYCNRPYDWTEFLKPQYPDEARKDPKWLKIHAKYQQSRFKVG